MGYNDDICLYQWTPGQAEAMRANYDAYRVPERSLDSPPILLSEGVPSEPQHILVQNELRVYSLAGLFDGTVRVECTATAATGDLDLFMNWDASLESFECTSTEGWGNETCSMTTTAGQIETSAFALIFGATAATEAVVVCDSISDGG